MRDVCLGISPAPLPTTVLQPHQPSYSSFNRLGSLPPQDLCTYCFCSCGCPSSRYLQDWIPNFTHVSIRCQQFRKNTHNDSDDRHTHTQCLHYFLENCYHRHVFMVSYSRMKDPRFHKVLKFSRSNRSSNVVFFGPQSPDISVERSGRFHLKRN